MSTETKENKKEKKRKDNIESINNALMAQHLKQVAERMKIHEKKLNEIMEILEEISEALIAQSKIENPNGNASETETILEIDAKIARRMEEFEVEFERKIKKQKVKSNNITAYLIAIIFIMLFAFLFK